MRPRGSAHRGALQAELTGPQRVALQPAQGCWLHGRLLVGFLPAARQALAPPSLRPPSEALRQRTVLVWVPPPQLAEQGDHGSARHLQTHTSDR